MLSYDGVIRKRLRLKGHPEIPPYDAQSGDEQPLDGDGNGDRPPTGAAESSSPSVQAADDDVQHGRAEDGGALSGAAESAHGAGAGAGAGADDGQPPEQAQDVRTGAEKRFSAVAEAREQERVMKEASKSYRDKVDQFNKRLAQAPEHNDMFNTSFTK